MGFFPLLTELLCLFIAQQLTSQPLWGFKCQRDWECGHSLSSNTKCSHLQAYRHMGAQFISKQLWKCESDWDVPNSFWNIQMLLNGLSLVPPSSEVTLSFQSALQMNWALCQQWSSLEKQKSGCEVTLVIECPFTIPCPRHSLSWQIGTCAQCML